MIKELVEKVGFVLFVSIMLCGVGPLCILCRFITIIIYRCRGYRYDIYVSSEQQSCSEQQSWCLENNIEYKSNAEAVLSFVFGTSSPNPLIFFKKETDMIAFKLRWL